MSSEKVINNMIICFIVLGSTTNQRWVINRKRNYNHFDFCFLNKKLNFYCKSKSEEAKLVLYPPEKENLSVGKTN